MTWYRFGSVIGKRIAVLFGGIAQLVEDEFASWKSGLRIPCSSLCSRRKDSEDCRAGALAQADTFWLALSFARATTRQASHDNFYVHIELSR